MPYKKSISGTERRQRDYLRRRGLQVAAVYQGRLQRDRRKELRRVLELALDFTPEALPDVLQEYLDESAYLPEWWTGLWTQAGLPMAKTTAQQLRAVKAAGEEDIWLYTIRQYAHNRAGNEIQIVSGTWKDSLVKLVRNTLEDDLTIGIEKLTKRVYDSYIGDLEKWQCRRIAQTEAMIGMADASALAATTLDIPFTKQWCISGLGNTRESHEMMDGVIVDEDEPFRLPGGLMMYPHDVDLGADASEIINCACDCIRRPKSSQSTTPTTAPVQTQEPVISHSDEQRIQAIMKEKPDDLPEATRRILAEEDLKLERELGAKKGKPMSITKADEQSANPNYDTGEKQYQINCVTCSHSYALRRRGFDVYAKGRVAGSKSTTDLAATYEMGAAWKNADGTRAQVIRTKAWMEKKKYDLLDPKNYEEFFKEVCDKPGDYEFTLTWRGGETRHTTIIHKDKSGNLYWIEPQHYNGTTKRSITDLCSGLTRMPVGDDGLLYLDDKIFDRLWTGLFEIN